MKHVIALRAVQSRRTEILVVGRSENDHAARLEQPLDDVQRACELLVGKMLNDLDSEDTVELEPHVERFHW